MHETASFVALALAGRSPLIPRRCAGSLGAHGAVSLAGHRPDPRQVEVHDAD